MTAAGHYEAGSCGREREELLLLYARGMDRKVFVSVFAAVMAAGLLLSALFWIVLYAS